MAIFDIEKDELLRLSDTQLEELIARLAEAEVTCSPLINTHRFLQRLHKPHEDNPMKKRFSDEQFISILRRLKPGFLPVSLP